jgi:putative phage-type endonuclease
MKIHNVEQRSTEWLQLKAGKISGSIVKGIFAKNNLPLIDQLIAEQFTGEITDVPVNYAMQRGIDREHEALAAIEKELDIKFKSFGLCEHENLSLVVLSPDGFTDDLRVGVEIKCPSAKKHIEYIRMDKIPSDYIYQIYMYFFVNEKCESVIFASYCPEIEVYPLFHYAVHRKDVELQLAEFELEILDFIEKLNKYKNKILW